MSIPNGSRPRRIAERLGALVLLALAPLGARAQHPDEWQAFDHDDPVRRLENRFALIASDGQARAGADAAEFARALARHGWSVRLFADGRRAPQADEWQRDWRDLASSCGEYDTLLVAWISAGPPPEDLGPWMRRLTTARAAQKILFVDALRRNPSDPLALPDPPPLQPSWRDEVFTVLASAWAQPSYEGESAEGDAAEERPRAHGLYLDAFLVALSAKTSDLNGDHYVSLREAHQTASARAARRAFELGRAQRATIASEPNPSVDAWLRDLLVEPKKDQPRARPRDGAAAAVEAPPKEPRRAGNLAALQPVRRAALRWLLSAQAEDGRWDADAFPYDGPPDAAGRGRRNHDVGVTGLAMLALLGAQGSAEDAEERAVAVERGARWLLTTFDEEGILGGRSGHAFLYDHGIATYALCATLAARDLPSLRAGAERAVRTVLRARNPYKAWRYELPPNGENDTSMTLWMTLALEAARRAKIEVDGAAFEGALSFLDEMTDLDTGRCGYIQRGQPPARTTKGNSIWPASSSESLTAGAALLRRMLKKGSAPDPALEAHLDLVFTKPPQASADFSTHDFYYWSFGARALSEVKSADAERWRAALASTLRALQVASGEPAAGSFDPNDPWGEEEGRVGTTAHAVLALNALLGG